MDKLFFSDKLISEFKKIANSKSPVLICGESGVGKEVVAKYIHSQSQYSKNNEIVINISSIPDDLIEKELFGSVEGAFTGANKSSKGKLELGHGSTIILDDIDKLNYNIQGKLLQFIEKGIVERVGESNTIHIDTRIIAITTNSLFDLVNQGKFRKDLFYRINVLNLSNKTIVSSVS